MVERFERLCSSCVRWLYSPLYGMPCVCLCLFALFYSRLGADPDLFARVAAGRLVEIFGGVVWYDPFAYTPKKQYWIDHEWFSGVVFYYIATSLSDWGLFAAKIAFACYTLVLLCRAQLRQTSHPKFYLPWLLVALTQCSSIWMSTIRAQVFTYVFFAYQILACVEYRKRHNAALLLFLPFVQILWCNSHGGFVVGLGCLGLFSLCMLSEGFKRALIPAAMTVLCAAATFVNPYGIEYWRYIVDAITMPRPSITEWAPVSLLDPAELLFHIYLVVFFWGAWTKKRDVDPEVWVLGLVTAIYGYRHVRLVPLFMFVAVVYGTDFFALVMLWLRPRIGRFYRMIVNCAAFLLIAWSAVFLVWPLKFVTQLRDFSLDYSGYPLYAMEWLYQHGLGGNLLIDFNRGSFALWRGYPRYLISLDGRYEEVYPEETVATVVSALNAGSEENAKAFEMIRPDYIIVDRESANYRNRGKYPGRWAIIYEDKKFAVLSAAPHPPPIEGSTKNDWQTQRVTARPMWQPAF